MVSKLVKGIVLGLVFVGAVSTVNASSFDVGGSAAYFSNKKVGDVFTIDLNDDVVNKLVSDHVAAYMIEGVAKDIENKMDGSLVFSMASYSQRTDNIDGENVIVREIGIVKYGPHIFTGTENELHRPSVLRNDKMLVLMDLSLGLKNLVEAGFKSITYKSVQCASEEYENVPQRTGIVITGIN